MPRWSLKHTYIVLIAAVGLVGCPPEVPDPEPVANFSATPRSGNTGLSVSFTDLSTPGAGGSILSWRWDFGDGAQSTSPNPTHTYLTPGSYDVSLTVASSGGSHTRTRVGYIQISTPAGSVSLDETGGTASSNGVRITAAAGALEGDVSFGITRVNNEIQFNVFETINRVGDTFRITHDSDSNDVTGSTMEAPVQPLELAIPYAEDVVPTGSRIPAKVQILAQLDGGLVVPIVGQIRSGAVVASVTSLPASALYTVVYRPDAYIEVVAGDANKVATSTSWNDDWQVSLSPVLLRQLTALRLGSVQRPSSFGNRQFTDAQLSDTVAALGAGLAALQGDMEGVRARAPRLVSLNGAYTIAFYNSVNTYPTAIGSIANVFYGGSPFGSVVVDPAQLLAISTWNADRFAANPDNVDIAFKVSANRALSEVITRAVVEGYDYPEITVASPADGGDVAVTAGLSEGLALYLGQMYGGMAASRAQLEGDYALLTTPVLAPIDPAAADYAGSSQEFFRYVNNRYEPENPLAYIAGGTGAVKGILEEARLALASANAPSVEAASRLIATAVDNAFFAYLDVSVGVAYREFALDLAFEHGQPSLLRPSDATRLPLLLDEERFAAGSIETVVLNGPDGGADFEESLANMPPLTTRAIVVSADPEAASLTFIFNRSDWVVDARNQSIYAVVYREGLPGTVLPENATTLTFTDFEADLGKDTADFIVLIVNQSVSTFNSVEIAVDSAPAA